MICSYSKVIGIILSRASIVNTKPSKHICHEDNGTRDRAKRGVGCQKWLSTPPLRSEIEPGREKRSDVKRYRLRGDTREEDLLTGPV